MITGIVIALTEELATLIPNKLKQGETVRLSQNATVIYSGAGAKNAKNAAEELVKNGATRLISWGCAAGLLADTTSGTLIIADQCIAADNTVINSHPGWLQHSSQALAMLSPKTGAIAESNAVVTTSADKMQFGLSSKAIALDMESAAIARVAQNKGLPFLALRAIADPQQMDLPKAVGYAINAQGEVKIHKLLSYLLLHPQEIPGLIRLALHFNAAKRTLRLVAANLDKIINFPIETATS